MSMSPKVIFVAWQYLDYNKIYFVSIGQMGSECQFNVNNYWTKQDSQKKKAQKNNCGLLGVVGIVQLIQSYMCFSIFLQDDVSKAYRWLWFVHRLPDDFWQLSTQEKRHGQGCDTWLVLYFYLKSTGYVSVRERYKVSLAWAPSWKDMCGVTQTNSQFWSGYQLCHLRKPGK